MKYPPSQHGWLCSINDKGRKLIATQVPRASDLIEMKSGKSVAQRPRKTDLILPHQLDTSETQSLEESVLRYRALYER